MVRWLRSLFKSPDPDPRQSFIVHQEQSEEPWAMFEVVGFEPNGQIKIKFSWNDEFIAHLNAIGFQAETEEDTVQLFFYTSQMKPTSLTDLGGDESVQSAEHPNLSGPVNAPQSRIVK